MISCQFPAQPHSEAPHPSKQTDWKTYRYTKLLDMSWKRNDTHKLCIRLWSRSTRYWRSNFILSQHKLQLPAILVAHGQLYRTHMKKTTNRAQWCSWQRWSFLKIETTMENEVAVENLTSNKNLDVNRMHCGMLTVWLKLTAKLRKHWFNATWDFSLAGGIISSSKNSDSKLQLLIRRGVLLTQAVPHSWYLKHTGPKP